MVDQSDTRGYLIVSSDDLNLYFQNTFLRFKDSKKWENVTNFIISGNNKRMVATDACSDYREVSIDTIDFSFPEVGLYNYKNGVISLRRKSLRQNKKGMCNSTTDIYSVVNLYDRFFEVPYGLKLASSWRWVSSVVNSALLNPTYLSFDHAYKRVRGMSDFAKALSKDFFIGQGIISRAPALWFRQTLIGRCPAKTQIIIDNPAFEQEVLDHFLPQGISIDVA